MLLPSSSPLQGKKPPSGYADQATDSAQVEAKHARHANFYLYLAVYAVHAVYAQSLKTNNGTTLLYHNLCLYPRGAADGGICRRHLSINP